MITHKSKIPTNGITIDQKKIDKYGGNIYAIINVLGKRAEQISICLKSEFQKKLSSVVSLTDNLEDVFENTEQIKLCKAFERLPKPTNIAIREFLAGEIFFHKK